MTLEEIEELERAKIARDAAWESGDSIYHEHNYKYKYMLVEAAPALLAMARESLELKKDLAAETDKGCECEVSLKRCIAALKAENAALRKLVRECIEDGTFRSPGGNGLELKDWLNRAEKLLKGERA